MPGWPYTTKAWRQLRALKLASNPLCEYCPPGVVTPATQVDHRLAIKKGGDPWAWANLASTCAPCHTDKTNREDGGNRGQRRLGLDPRTGLPLDPRHWWSAKKSLRAGDEKPRPSTFFKKVHDRGP